MSNVTGIKPRGGINVFWVPEGLQVADGIDHDYPLKQFDDLEVYTPSRRNTVVAEVTDVPHKRNFFCRVGYSAGDELIYNRVWVEPLEVDAGFITEDVDTEIHFWNAKYEDKSYVSNVTSVLPDGTTFELTDYPFYLGVDEERIYDITTLKDGPPIQDTYYNVTIEGLVYSIYVYGTRVIPVDQEPDWGTPPKIRYRYQTVIATSPTYKEQRRSLTNRIMRDAIISFIIQDVLLTRFHHNIMYGHDKVFGIPIYSETSVLSAAANTGTVTLTLAGDCSKHWNLNQKATHVIIADYSNDKVEIKEIASLASQQIVLERQLVNDFTIGSVVFPCFFGTLKAVRNLSATDNTDAIDIEFQEFLLGTSA